MSRSAIATLERAKRGPTRAEIRAEAERIRSQAEAVAVSQGVAETVALREARGEEFTKPKQGRGERQKPVYKTDGPMLLLHNSAITPGEYNAVQKAAKLYRNLFHKGQCRSALNDSPRGSGDMSAADSRIADMRSLIRLKERAFQDHSRLIAIFNQFVGEGLRPSEMAYNRMKPRQLRLECVAVAMRLELYYRCGLDR